MTTILRARVAHTPRDPFLESGALETFDDGAVAFEDGTILATGPYAEVAGLYPDAEVHDRRDCFLFPGLVDTHPHLMHFGALMEAPVDLSDAASHDEIVERLVAAGPRRLRQTERGRRRRGHPLG